MLEAKFALNNLNFKCYFQFFFVRARIGPKKWGGQFDPPLVNRVLANTLVKEGLGLIYRLVISLFIFRRKPTSRSSRGIVLWRSGLQGTKLFKTNFVLVYKLSVILFSFCRSGKRFVVGEKGGVAALRILSCGKARSLFETRTIFFHSALRPNRKRVAFAFKGEPIL